MPRSTGLAGRRGSALWEGLPSSIREKCRGSGGRVGFSMGKGECIVQVPRDDGALLLPQVMPCKTTYYHRCTWSTRTRSHPSHCLCLGTLPGTSLNCSRALNRNQMDPNCWLGFLCRQDALRRHRGVAYSHDATTRAMNVTVERHTSLAKKPQDRINTQTLNVLLLS